MWSGRVDPDGNLYGFLHSGAALNDGHYANPIVDAGLDEARNSTDEATRIAAYTKMMTQERKDLPMLYLDHPVNIVGMSAKIHGFRAVPDGMIRLQGLSMAK
jgi:peptide/nickel transport system substrate-binding protein